MKQYHMTARQVQKACKKHPYLLFRNQDLSLVGLNGSIAKIAQKKGIIKPRILTSFIGFIPCSFQQYIFYKIPFITK